MSSDMATRLADKFQYRAVPKGDYLLKEGKISNHAHFLEDGFVRSYTFNTEGSEVTMGLFAAPCVVNSLQSFFKRQPSRENLQALTDCTTWYITFDDLQTQFHTIPEFREWGRLMLINSHAQLQDRVLGMIQNTAEERYAKLVQTQPAIFQNVPLKMIASYLGVTDTSLSRIRKEFGKNK